MFVGHQVVCRNKQLQKCLVGKVAPATEEILASLVGSWLVQEERGRHSLILNTLEEAVQCGLSPNETALRLNDIPFSSLDYRKPRKAFQGRRRNERREPGHPASSCGS